MVKEINLIIDCACTIAWGNNETSDEIRYCSLHAAASDLLTACEEAARALYYAEEPPRMVRAAEIAVRAAIAKARGESSNG